MADEAKTKVKITLDGVEMEIESGNRVLSQLKNLQETAKQEKFAEARKEVLNKLANAVEDVTNEDGDVEDALSGMSLVYNFEDGTKSLVETSKIVIKQRVPKAATVA